MIRTLLAVGFATALLAGGAPTDTHSAVGGPLQKKPVPKPDVFRPRSAPERLDTSWRQDSESGRYVASIKSMSRPLPINKIHNWTVRIRRQDGSPVAGAEITFDGGMPAHNHGFPTEPKITKHLGSGTYLLEGVKFSMTGWWRFEFKIRDGERVDSVVFNVVLDD